MQYPTLRFAVLQGLLALKHEFDNDPAVLKDGSCPYDAETVEILTQILKTSVEIREVKVEVAAPVVADERGGLLDAEEKELVNQTIGELLKQLNELGEGEKSLDTQTKVQIIKAKATLIDQMLKMHERIMNVKRISGFHAVVMSILDDLVAEADRQTFLKRMEPYCE